MRAPLSNRRLSSARRRTTAPAGSRGLELASFAGLRVVTFAPQVSENAGLLHFLLEALERPVEAIVVAELNLDQSAVLLWLGLPWGAGVDAWVWRL